VELGPLSGFSFPIIFSGYQIITIQRDTGLFQISGTSLADITEFFKFSCWLIRLLWLEKKVENAHILSFLGSTYNTVYCARLFLQISQHHNRLIDSDMKGLVGFDHTTWIANVPLIAPSILNTTTLCRMWIQTKYRGWRMIKAMQDTLQLITT
jgi:hypothetical protein